ncbi:acyltransferase [uncultured Aquitalea sp.]|uniref:acyltransferase family protein n=1 Tax=uncultured Aquitalea sp. TaxID=540272 RepID=UPI0025E13EB9|nr:acyltransferase [uncultured Aquitalea sp.]
MRKFTNNFDFLRMAAALCVLYSHQYALMGQAEPAFFPGQTFGSTGVFIFFAISGYLVCESWVREPHVGLFVAKRMLRIWPGLAVNTLLCALLLGPVVSRLPANAYFGAPELFHYFSNLYFRMTYFLPGVFEDNPYPVAVNGSLWTIPLEISCYLSLMFAGVMTLLGRRLLTLGITVLVAVFYFYQLPHYDNLAIKLALFFYAGSCMQLFRDYTSRMGVVAPVLVTGLAALFLGQSTLASLLLLPYLAIQLGSRSYPVLNQAGRFGDFSYGTYIYAFPVQQTLLHLMRGSELPLAWYLLSSTVITILLAAISWHAIEHPALKLKHQLPRLPRKTKNEVTRQAN